MHVAHRTAALVLVLVLLAAAPPARAADPLAGRFGGPFALIDEDGRAVDERDFLGRHLLVSFGYTRCPDVCPIGLGRIAAALDLLGQEAARLTPVFITVDPARDTPAVLRAYTAAFDARLIGLTGDEAAIRAVAKAYKVHRRKVLTDRNDPDAYLIDHGSLTYLMAPDGGFLTLIPYGASAERMAEVVGGYLEAGH